MRAKRDPASKQAFNALLRLYLTKTALRRLSASFTLDTLHHQPTNAGLGDEPHHGRILSFEMAGDSAGYFH